MAHKYQVLARKYRPKKFCEVVGQPHVVKAITNSINNDMLHHGYIFSGSHGIGKTSLCRLFAKAMNCHNKSSADPCEQCSSCVAIEQESFLDMIEINGAQYNKVDDLEPILEKVHHQAIYGQYKTIIIDEVHMLSNYAFNRLLKLLEEPPLHAKFMLATTQMKKLPDTIISRCIVFNLNKITVRDTSKKLAELLNKENIAYETKALKNIAYAAQGSMRDALNITDHIMSASEGRALLNTNVLHLLGKVNEYAIDTLVVCLIQKDSYRLYEQIEHIISLNVDLVEFCEDLCRYFYHAYLFKIFYNSVEYGIDLEIITKLANGYTKEDLKNIYDLLAQTKSHIPLSSDNSTLLTINLLEICQNYFPIFSEIKEEVLETENPLDPSIIKRQTNEEDNEQSMLKQRLMDEPWDEIVEKLDITTLQEMILKNTLVSKKGKFLYLTLDKKAKMFPTERMKTKIKEEISKYLSEDISVIWIIKDGKQEDKDATESLQDVGFNLLT